MELSLHVFGRFGSGSRLGVIVPTLTDTKKNRRPKRGVELDEQIKMKQIES